MPRAVFILACAALFVGLCTLNVWVNRPRIERDLTTRTTDVLEKKPLSVRQVRFAGRDGAIVLEETADAAAEAQKLAEGVFGVRVAQVTAIQKALPGFRAERTASGLRLTGDLPDASAIETIVSQARLLEPEKTINEMKENRNVQRAEYLSGLPATLAWLSRVEVPSTLELRDRTLSLEGAVADEAARAELENAARAQTPAGLSFVSRLTVPQRAMTAQAEPVPPSPPVEPPTPPPAPIPVPAAVPETGADFKTELEERRLNFEYDSVELAQNSEPDVEPLAKFLKAHPRAIVKIVGYADYRGTKEYNRDLGTRRAEEMKSRLVEEGVGAQTLRTEGRGAVDFIADNATEAGMAKNRRVEFRVVKGP